MQERWQHSGSAISAIITEVANAIVRLKRDFIRMPDRVDANFLSSRPEYAHFPGAIGAIDGTLIPACIRIERQQPFYDRHSNVSQNVLAVVSFSDLFLYVLAGWEGSAHDSTVFQDAVLKGTPHSHRHIPVG
ncbi:unnamed protein product [Closterium sp. Yama58-4]|nr:unnamed protein product [Closterium sp. Yama58-4]